MIEMYQHLDTLNAFMKLHDAWLLSNNESWHSNEIVKQLKRIDNYVNQLASYISMHHDDIDVQVDIDIDALRGKKFSTVIKRTDEWKSLRKWIKKSHNFRQQTITVEALCKCILKETTKLIQIV